MGCDFRFRLFCGRHVEAPSGTGRSALGNTGSDTGAAVGEKISVFDGGLADMRPVIARGSRLHTAASKASRTAGAAAREYAARSRSLSSSADVDVVVCGAGVVGVACAHYLAARGARVTLIDERPALSYTSALSTECYRNWWGGDPTMTAFMDRSAARSTFAGSQQPTWPTTCFAEDLLDPVRPRGEPWLGCRREAEAAP